MCTGLQMSISAISVFFYWEGLTSTNMFWTLNVLRFIKGIVQRQTAIVLKFQFQLLLILIEDVVWSISRKNYVFMMKIEPVACIWMIEHTMNFWAARNGKNWSCWLSRRNLCELWLFHQYFLCLFSFWVISMMIMVILGQNELFWLILKYFFFFFFINCTFNIHKNAKKYLYETHSKIKLSIFMLNETLKRLPKYYKCDP